MVDVGMGEQDEIQLFGPVGGRVEIAFFEGRIALEHAAVHGKAGLVGLYHEAGTRNGLCCAEKSYLHSADSWVTGYPILRT